MNAALWPWIALVLLGAWHGINPGMGWLFSVALGLQQRSRGAVFHALLPIALGHAIAIALVGGLVLLLSAEIPFEWLQITGSLFLMGIAFFKLWRGRHPTWVGMQVNFWDLTIWSLIMASAHGAGLMILPVFLGLKSSSCGSPAQADFFPSIHISSLELLAFTRLVIWLLPG